ncbi:MAG: hypothetical protein IKC10_07745 [Alphaproteobacteria bacterium]|nr:hypothetical protein [Alphaproteobacteria bacterium]
MDNENFYNILNELFFSFEENIFVNNGIWPRKVNLIFAFWDYIETMSDAQIADILITDDATKIEQFRFVAKQGIEKWLNENMKTLMI